jgi:hypothetical protein
MRKSHPLLHSREKFLAKFVTASHPTTSYTLPCPRIFVRTERFYSPFEFLPSSRAVPGNTVRNRTNASPATTAVFSTGPEGTAHNYSTGKSDKGDSLLINLAAQD